MDPVTVQEKRKQMEILKEHRARILKKYARPITKDDLAIISYEDDAKVDFLSKEIIKLINEIYDI